MAYRDIPEGSIEIQIGLWLYTSTFNVGSVTYTKRQLYSSEGYCFYDSSAEVYREDEEGNLVLVPNDEVLPTERVYMQYSTVAQTTDINVYVSVPVDDSYEIVSKPNNNEVA